MAYQISYGQDCATKTSKLELRLPKPGREVMLRAALVCSVILLLLTCLVPQVRLAVRNILLPGDPEITATALERLVAAVSGGETIPTALPEFCREIIDHGLQAV